ncbi:hypothetical protein VZT92_010540 [Zoarces viviparus]|uniref:Consortin C-terminal domain-containing protein n=1 Tax=Zoarces viviparus TaxID=48416 RepID=A0AAW1F8Y0_ZOAVI
MQFTFGDIMIIVPRDTCEKADAVPFGEAYICGFGDTYSNICTDFAHNVDFYVMNVRRFFEGLAHWLPLRT